MKRLIHATITNNNEKIEIHKNPSEKEFRKILNSSDSNIIVMTSNGNDIYEFPLELGMDKAFNNGISKDDYIMSLQGNTKDLTIYTTKNVDTIDKIKMNLNKFEKFNLAGNETIKIDCDKYESNADKELFNKISQEKINVIDFLHKYFFIDSDELINKVEKITGISSKPKFGGDQD